MIETPTTFVLGAGASLPYGLPSGTELKRRIVHLCQNANRQRELAECGVDASQVARFGAELRHSGLPSIDAFLEHRREYLEIGKLAIARTLIPCEQAEHLYEPVKPEDDWYGYLLSRLLVARDRFGENRLSIVTFNYDRSLEHFLFNALQATYHDGSNWEACAKTLQQIPIVHVHGQLGKLPWQDRRRHRGYGPAAGPEELKTAADELVIISEMDDDAPTLKAARHELSKAKRIYFLGFGYHPTNVKRLKLAFGTSKLISGTTYGLGAQERIELVRSKGITPDENNHTVLSYLRNVVRFDS